MNSKKLCSIVISLILICMFDRPESDATLISPLKIYTVAKLGTMKVIGAVAAKGALLGKAALLKAPLIAVKGPLIAKKLLLAKTAAVVGGIAGAKKGTLFAKAKKPLVAIPNLISLAPLLTNVLTKNNKSTIGPPIKPTYPLKSYAPQYPQTQQYSPQYNSQYSSSHLSQRPSYSGPTFSSSSY